MTASAKYLDRLTIVYPQATWCQYNQSSVKISIGTRGTHFTAPDLALVSTARDFRKADVGAQ